MRWTECLMSSEIYAKERSHANDVSDLNELAFVPPILAAKRLSST